MAQIKTNEQYRAEYIPKIRKFADEQLTPENSKRIYGFLKPYHYDTGGWHLYQAAKGILQADVYDEFPAEENVKFLDSLDGYGRLLWLEIAKFVKKDYQRPADDRILLKTQIIDENLPEYREYQSKLWNTAIRSMALTLSDKQPYLLEGFWNRLSYIGNILEKGWPTRDDLNEKIAAEAKKVCDSASEDDLTSFHSEAEIKTQLRNALLDTSMTDEMIQALYITDDVLGDAYRFFTEESKDNQVYLAVWKYLEKAEHDYLAHRVFDRAKIEYENYIDEVKKMPVDKIIDEAYKITLLDDLHMSLDPETSSFSTERLKALYSLASPLWSLYDEWQRRDWTYMDDIKDVIYDVADKTANENEKSEFEVDPDPFGLDDEDEDEQEI